MRKFKCILFLTGLLCIFFPFSSSQTFAQFEKVEQITTFFTRIDNPVKIEVTTHEERVKFAAVNRSHYPYEIEIKFNILHNLIPRVHSRRFVVGSGNTNLFELRKQHKNLHFDFNYSVRSFIGDPNLVTDTLYPYLIPLRAGKAVDFIGLPVMDTVEIIRNTFASDPGEAVLNMRKGKITAVFSERSYGPNFYQDKISQLSIVEVMHRDGTIAVYYGIDPDNLFVNTSDIVYPGEPLGLTDKEGMVTVHLFQLTGKGNFKYMDIYFAINEEELVLFKDLFNKTIKHPLPLIEKEMNRREKRLFRRGKLY